MIRIVAWCYTVLVFLTAAYAWVGNIALRNDTTEHLLPAIPFCFVTLPLSLNLDVLYSLAPSLIDLPFADLAFLTICAVIQCMLLWWFSEKILRRKLRQVKMSILTYSTHLTKIFKTKRISRIERANLAKEKHV